MERKLVAALACRNQGSRLYGKPLQNLDVDTNYRIIDNIVDCLINIKPIDEIVLGVAEGKENEIFCDFAQQKNIQYIIGDETDVLSRLIKCGEIASATDIFRVTSESPFPFFEAVEENWNEYSNSSADALFMDDIVDGCNFEIISLAALKTSHSGGEDRHRSELCTLYIRENLDKFDVLKKSPDKMLVRKDLRLTVDNPEDLVVCRAIYDKFKGVAPLIPVSDIIKFLDANPQLIELTAPFTEEGYKTMYL